MKRLEFKNHLAVVIFGLALPQALLANEVAKPSLPVKQQLDAKALGQKLQAGDLRSNIGTNSGGGGDAVLCYKTVAARNQVHQFLESVKTESASVSDDSLKLAMLSKAPEMLDTFDNAQYGLFNPTSNNSGAALQEKEIHDAIAAVDPMYWSLFSKYISNERQWVPKSNGVATLNDYTVVQHFPSNCLIVQVAYYDDRFEKIFYDARIVSLMEPRSRVILKLHEDTYRFYRSEVNLRSYSASFFSGGSETLQKRYEISTVTSDSTRNLVSLLAMTLPFDKREFYLAARKVAVRIRNAGKFEVAGLSRVYTIRDYKNEIIEQIEEAFPLPSSVVYLGGSPNARSYTYVPGPQYK